MLVGKILISNCSYLMSKITTMRHQQLPQKKYSQQNFFFFFFQVEDRSTKIQRRRRRQHDADWKLWRHFPWWNRSTSIFPRMTLGPKSKRNNAQTFISPIVKYKPPPKFLIKFQNNWQILLDKESKIETKSQSSSRSSSFGKKLTTDSATREACHFYTITSPPLLLFLRHHSSAFLLLKEPIR